MKILHVLKSNSYSGAENIAITICANMQKYMCAYTSPIGPIEEKLKEQNIKYYPMKKFCVMELRRVVKEFDPDVIHAHDFSASVFATVLFGKKTPIISHLHNNVPWIKNWNIRSFAYRFALDRIERVVLVSDCIIKEAIFAGRMVEKYKILGNPIDKKNIRRMAEKFLCGKFDVLFVGRLTEAKNPMKFINIIDKLVKYIPYLKAGIIGDGDLFMECENRIVQLHLENNICMKGFCKNPYPYIKNAKIMLVTSEWEGFGLVAREAFALKTPILLPDVGGMHELVLEYPKIKCETEEEYVCKANKILNEDSEWIKFYEGVYNEQENKDDLQSYLKSIDKIYQDCCCVKVQGVPDTMKF